MRPHALLGFYTIMTAPTSIDYVPQGGDMRQPQFQPLTLDQIDKQ